MMVETTCLRVLIITMILTATHGQGGSYITCCEHCRGDAEDWTGLSSTFDIGDGVTLTSPAAFLVDDVRELSYQSEGREYKLRYAGSPISVRYNNLIDPSAVQTTQYIQTDLTETKSVGGVLTQGGYYEERLQGLYPKTSSWFTKMAVSISNDSITWNWMRDLSNNIKVFPGNSDMDTRNLVSFDTPVPARYVRIHPLQGQNDNGNARNVMARTTVITCGTGICSPERVNCLASEWTSWGVCACANGGCSRLRMREILNHGSCGGRICGGGRESESCTPADPIWKLALQYSGIALAGVVVICVIVMLVYKKKRGRRVEVIVVKDIEDNDDYDDDDNNDMEHPPPAHPAPRPLVVPPPGAFNPRAPFMPRPPPSLQGPPTGLPTFRPPIGMTPIN